LGSRSARVAALARKSQQPSPTATAARPGARLTFGVLSLLCTARRNTEEPREGTPRHRSERRPTRRGLLSPPAWLFHYRVPNLHPRGQVERYVAMTQPRPHVVRHGVGDHHSHRRNDPGI